MQDSCLKAEEIIWHTLTRFQGKKPFDGGKGRIIINSKDEIIAGWTGDHVKFI